MAEEALLEAADHSSVHFCDLNAEEPLKMRCEIFRPANYVVLIKTIDQIRTRGDPTVLQEQLCYLLKIHSNWTVDTVDYMNVVQYLDRAEKLGYIRRTGLSFAGFRLGRWSSCRIRSTGKLEAACGRRFHRSHFNLCSCTVS